MERPRARKRKALAGNGDNDSCYSDSEEKEALQAELIKWLYSVWFSHENMEQIIYWNLVDGYAAFTEPGDVERGENLFYGDYEPEITADGKTYTKEISLHKNGKNEFEVKLL